MLAPRWHKVLADLWSNKTRTALVVVSIAVGVFAFSMIADSHAILTRNLGDSYAAINPVSARLVIEPFDDDLLQAVRKMPEVRDAEGRASILARVRKLDSDAWFNLELSAISDFDDIRINKVRPESGAWPPPKHELLLERASLAYIGASVGDVVLAEMPGGRQREVRIAGRVHDLYPIPPLYSFTTYGYITFDTFEWLGEARSFNRLYVTVADRARALDKGYIRNVAQRVKDRVEDSGRTVLSTEIPEPGKAPLSFVTESMTLVLGVLGGLTLLLGGFLVINTVSGLLAQQVRQIGVMKAVGARTHQVLGMYLALALVFGLLAVVIPVPLGALAARGFAGYMADILNFDLASFNVPPPVLALEVAVGLLVPVLAALYPVLAGTRLTVREAISSYGLTPTPALPLVGGGLGEGRFLPRPLLLSLRNTFRRKGRLALTLTTLTLAGAIFIAVFSVRDSLLLSVDEVSRYWRYDIDVTFSRAYRVERIEREALSVPGVVRVESWGTRAVVRRRADGTEGDSISLVAPPAATRMIQPQVLRGRWLLPDDENALVINTDLLKKEPDIAVGDEVALMVAGRETTWRVVGLVTGSWSGGTAYANRPYFARTVRDVGHTSRVVIETAQHDEAFQGRVKQALEEQFQRAGLQVSAMQPTAETRSRITNGMSVLVVFLSVMAVLLAAVGALGLMGTMSLNVLERMREIGVMRAIGASDAAIRQIVIGEAVVVGVLSWLIGAVLAVPLSKFLSDEMGSLFMNTPFSYAFSAVGVVTWLVAAVMLAALASFVPAWRASRLAVREVLAYE